MSTQVPTSKDIVKVIYAALEDKKAEEIKALDIQEISIVADFFIIASGNNINHIRAMADEVEEQLRKNGFTVHNREGYQTAKWILLDCGTVVVHLFNKEDRELYNLEKVWKEAKELQI